VEVVEDDDRGSSGDRLLDCLAHDVVQPITGGVGRDVIVDRGAELWQQRGEDRAQVDVLAVGDAQRAKHLHPRPQGWRSLVVVAAPPARPNANLPSNGRQLRAEARLADARLALDQHDPGSSGRRLVHRGPKTAEGVGSADEDRPGDHGRRQPYRRNDG
jgi:hypothetical protein